MTTRTRAWPATSHHWRTLYDGMDWATDAACSRAYPEIFFPAPGSTGREAKAFCARCPVATAASCLNYAMQHKEHGVWGGTTDSEREAIRRRRRREAS